MKFKIFFGTGILGLPIHKHADPWIDIFLNLERKIQNFIMLLFLAEKL